MGVINMPTMPAMCIMCHCVVLIGSFLEAFLRRGALLGPLTLCGTMLTHGSKMYDCGSHLLRNSHHGFGSYLESCSCSVYRSGETPLGGMMLLVGCQGAPTLKASGDDVWNHVLRALHVLRLIAAYIATRFLLGLWTRPNSICV